MTADRRAPDPIGQIIDELRASHPDANPLRADYYRTREDHEMAIAEDRDGQRRSERG